LKESLLEEPDVHWHDRFFFIGGGLPMERIPTFSVVVEFSSVPAFQWGQLAFDFFFALSFLYLFFYLHALHALRIFIWYAD